MCVSHFQQQQNTTYRVQLSWVLNFSDVIMSEKLHTNTKLSVAENVLCITAHAFRHIAGTTVSVYATIAT